jgi:hypothetical protein
MLKETVRHSELRMCDSKSATGGDGKPKYTTAGNLFWSFDGKQVEVSMLNGPVARSVLREILSFFTRRGVDRLIADRAAGHILPLARKLDDGRYEMKVSALNDRFMPAGDTDWMPL